MLLASGDWYRLYLRSFLYHDTIDIIQIYRGYSNFSLNMDFISSSEVENVFFMSGEATSGEATNEIYIVFTTRVK